MDRNVKNYNQTFPDYPPLVQSGKWLYGVWVLGNQYKRKVGYYGEYPPTYLKRILALFPDSTRVLHLFAGVNEGDERFTTFDINPELNPDVQGDAHELSKHFDKDSFDLVLADPPYSDEDAAHYGTPMVKRNTVVKECAKIITPGGFLVWLDQILPMFRKDEFDMVGTIGIVGSTNHRFRVVAIFRRR